MEQLINRVYVLQFLRAALLMASASTIILNTMKITSDVSYNWGELLGLALSLVMYRYIECTSIRERMIRGWRYTVTMLALVQVGIIVLSWYVMEWRFFAMAVVLSNVGEGASMIKEAVVNELLQRVELTEFNIRATRWFRTGQIVGLIGILTYTQQWGQLPVEAGLGLHGLVCLLDVLNDSLWYRHYESLSNQS